MPIFLYFSIENRCRISMMCYLVSKLDTRFELPFLSIHYTTRNSPPPQKKKNNNSHTFLIIMEFVLIWCTEFRCSSYIDILLRKLVNRVRTNENVNIPFKILIRTIFRIDILTSKLHKSNYELRNKISREYTSYASWVENL